MIKLDYIKSLDAEFKQLLSVDKKYQPIQKSLAALLRSMNPELQKIKKKHEGSEEDFVKESLAINKNYAENLENFHRSLNLLVEKNHQEVEKNQKIKLQQTHDLNLNLKAQLDGIDERMIQVNLDAKEKISKADQALKRELAQIQKVMNEVRRIYQEASQAIDIEQKDSIKIYGKNFDEDMAELALKEEKIHHVYQAIKDENKQMTFNVSKDNDDSYLLIKNTYSQLSIILNKKINELKKRYQQIILELDKDHQDKMDPIEKAILDLKANYAEAQRKALQNYTEKMSSLNVIFDVQKRDYEIKKERIIHDGNEAITLLNSKLSAYRETTQREKLIKAREIRDEIKSLESEKEQDKKNRELTSMMNQFDSDLNKQIIRTNKDIQLKKKETQKRLYDLDQKHLKEINEWRLKKVLFDYEKKQDFAKIDLNFNHNLGVSELQKSSEIQTYQYKKDLILMQHNKDLLSLEYQLMIGASIQERELNLLANDAHMAVASFKLKEIHDESEYKKELLNIQYQKDILKTTYDADLKVLNATTQLELEKEKVKRDFILQEQDLRVELSHALFTKQEALIKHDLQLQINELDHEREVLYLENKKTLDVIKLEALLEEVKREFVISEARYKHQQRMSNEKATRLLKTYQNELEHNQLTTECLMDALWLYHHHDQTFMNHVIDLYKLPSHPEVFKGFLLLLIDKSMTFIETNMNLLEIFQAEDHAFYVKKIEDLTGYKYMLKHEDMMNTFDAELQKILEKKQAIEADIKSLEEQFFANQTELERHHLFINQLDKITVSIKIEKTHGTKHHDLKENQKLVSNHEHEIKRIKQQISRIEKQIDQKHQQITPLELEIEKIKKHQKEEETSLADKKRDEAGVFYRYLGLNKQIYEKMTQVITKRYEALKTFYQALYQEVYVTEAFLEIEMKKLNTALHHHETQLTLLHQRLMNVMLSFYMKEKNEQSQLTLGFKQSTLALIRSLHQSYTKQLKDIDNDHQKKVISDHHQIKTLKVKHQKKQELEELSYRKTLSIEQNVLKNLEDKITDNRRKNEVELRMLNENQLSIAQQYQSDHQVKLTEMKNLFDKQTYTIDQATQNATKSFQSTDESMTNKNQAIILKYQQAYDKYQVALKQKATHYDSEMTKSTENYQSRLLSERMTVKRMNKKREAELKNIIVHVNRFTHQTRNDQNGELSKELRLLRKSHYSKMRMLHLN
ncbi:MAG: hypothetical protein C4537_01605 [Acholeplasma sp.]|jgi:hypothetical protein|nr:MAG: hypothetical protein C4537_01605 [Acholeplasma sp.]